MRTMEVFERVLRGRRLSKRSRENYKLVFESLAKFSEEWPESVGVAQEWIGSLVFADSTVMLWFSLARSAGRYMQKVWKLENPFESVEKPSVLKKKRRYLKAEEVLRVVQACGSEYEGLLVMTLIDSSCRVGELAGLRGEDIGDNYFVVRGKTGERRYRLDSRLCEKVRGLSEDGKLVFGGVSSSGLSMRVMRIMRRAGLKGEKLGPHTLRHSSASLIAKETGSVLAVKAILQHDSIDSSMVYIHDVEEEVQKRISPLALVAKYGGETRQLSLPGPGETSADAEVVNEAVAIDDLVEEQFAVIEDGVNVRPLLKTEDLRLIREAFISYVRSGTAGRSEFRCRELLKRLLRRVK